MRYLCLIYDNEQQWATMPKNQSDTLMGEYGAFTEGLKQSGKYIAGEALKPTQTATTLRVRNGKVSTTDGPFAETKEQLGGLYLIDVPSLDDAIEAAARIPGARNGKIEIRPIAETG